VVKGSDQTYTWNTIPTAGQYAFSVYGPDGFLTSFAGTVVPVGQNAGKVPTVAATLVNSKTVDWPADADGYYDVTVTADTGDGFTRRYAGRIA